MCLCSSWLRWDSSSGIGEEKKISHWILMRLDIGILMGFFSEFRYSVIYWWLSHPSEKCEFVSWDY